MKNRRGQVAIFVALIFQILFLFFAMIINVGLLVHHKINLQNAVDLGAYYGAMKQAENMNAIGHVNYQIRQSWKLLTWRYRVIGSAGEVSTYGDASPFLKNPSLAANPVDADQDKIRTLPTSGGATAEQLRGFYEAPAFCITYVPFKPMPSNENTCRNMATMSGVKLFQPPAVIAGFQGFSNAIRSATQAMLDSAKGRCEVMGTWNYFMLGKFVVAYNLDQADRMATINKISNATSESTEDFYDIDGDSVSEGVEKTVKKNLTFANADGGLKVTMYNSLGSDACGKSTAATKPAKWLNVLDILPGFNYIDTYCSGSLAIIGKELVGGNMVSQTCNYGSSKLCGPHYYNTKGILKSEIDQLKNYIGRRQGESLENMTLGVEKNPWCMAYVGVKAETTPNIPFSPFGGVKLTARAFAKPFGGRVGPWYYNKWLPGQTQSSGSTKDEQLDPLLPKRSKDPAGLSADGKDRIVNYSRFIGDTFGLMSRMVLGWGARAIYKMDRDWASGGPVPISTGTGSPTFTDWDHLPFEFTNNSNGDALARNKSAGADKTPMRDLELAAISPDPFDMAYYSIEPDFYHNYYQRLKKGLMAKRGGLQAPQMLRPDLGAIIGDSKLEAFSVKDQILRVKSQLGNNPLSNYRVEDRQTYISLDWKNTLTGWADKSLIDYSLDTTKFGRCIFPTRFDDSNGQALKPPTSGNCVGGGSTGYSVKLVSSDYLNRSDLKLGGDAVGSGALSNPPPSDF